jgi:lipase chaperone LimK
MVLYKNDGRDPVTDAVSGPTPQEEAAREVGRLAQTYVQAKKELAVFEENVKSRKVTVDKLKSELDSKMQLVWGSTDE